MYQWVDDLQEIGYMFPEIQENQESESRCRLAYSDARNKENFDESLPYLLDWCGSHVNSGCSYVNKSQLKVRKYCKSSYIAPGG